MSENNEKLKQCPPRFRLIATDERKKWIEAQTARVKKLSEENAHTRDSSSCGTEFTGKFKPSPDRDPRFQQQNQTLRCYVMYTDFYRCEKILGENNNACTWFKDVFKSICPNAWIQQWDELRTHDPPLMPWHKGRKQGHFPGHTYGDE